MTNPKPYDIPKRRVLEAYRRVKANRGAAGIDDESIEMFDADLTGNLYKLWNRLSSGSYFPPPVKQVEIPKKNGGVLRKAIAKHIKDPWCLLYIERWLTASAVSPDGQPVQRTKGVPQGSVIGPVMMNLFMTYAFDEWMKREHPNNPFSRYADDAVAHCRSEAEAKKLLAAIEERLKECKLEMHPEKSGIVYCKDSNRRNDYPRISFTFLGYEFRPRSAKSRDGKTWTGFLPAISASAKKRIRQAIREWNLPRQTSVSLNELARRYNPHIRGWMNYYSHFRKSALYRLYDHIDQKLVR